MDMECNTVDFVLTARRDKAAVLHMFEKFMKASSIPDKVAMDKSGADKAAIDGINASRVTPIVVRQVKYLNNIVEHDHLALNQATKPMLNFKSFRAAKNVLAGLELMHMIRKGQLMMDDYNARSFVFEELASIPTQNTFVNWQRDRTVKPFKAV